MKTFIEKIKVPLAVILSAMLIIGVAALICAVPEGNKDKNEAIKETVSEITDEDISFEEILRIDDTEIYLPDLESEIVSVTTRTGKKYTEKEIRTQSGSVTVKKYNHAYLIEDDVISIPNDAEKFMWHDTEVFVFESSRGTTAVYYKELVRYIITDSCGVEEMIKLFE